MVVCKPRWRHGHSGLEAAGRIAAAAGRTAPTLLSGYLGGLSVGLAASFGAEVLAKLEEELLKGGTEAGSWAAQNQGVGWEGGGLRRTQRVNNTSRVRMCVVGRQHKE